MKTDILVSIIVPVYNLGSILYKSIPSILRQSYKNLEIILVDDGSTDDTAKVCETLAADDERICILHQKNQGVSAARNIGLEKAKGEYIAFIDGDDIIAPFYIERLMEGIEDSALSMCTHERVTSYEYSFDDTKDNFTILDAYECASRLLRGKFPVCVWGGLFKKSLIGDLRFTDGIRNNEDKLFLFTFLINNSYSKVAFVNQKMYGYIIRSGSATGKKWDNNFDVITVADKMKEIVSSTFPQWNDAATVNAVRARLNTVRWIIRSREKNTQFQQTLKELRNEIIGVHIPRQSGMQMKIELLFLRLGLIPYEGLVRMYHLIYNDAARTAKNEKATYLQ